MPRNAANFGGKTTNTMLLFRGTKKREALCDRDADVTWATTKNGD